MTKNNILTSVLDKPIFLIGIPRNGTTIIHEGLCRHESLGCLSNYSEMAPSILALKLLRGILGNRILSTHGPKGQHDFTVPGNRYLPQPDEVYSFWDYHARGSFAKDYLLGVRAKEDWVKDPTASVIKLLNYCDLHASTKVKRYVSENQHLTNMNRDTESTMSDKELLSVSRAMQPLLGELGYA